MSALAPSYLDFNPSRAKEVCRCGHGGLAHADGFRGCMYNGCDCVRFTWIDASRVWNELTMAARAMLVRATVELVAGPQAAALARMGLVVYAGHCMDRRRYRVTALGRAVAGQGR